MSTLPMEINPIASLQTYGDDSDEGNEEDNETTEEINENVDSAETAAIEDENTEMTASMEVVQEPFNENVLIEECEQNIEEGLWDYCYWCFYRFTSPEEYKEHCSGIAHKQKMSRRYGAYIINNKKEELSELDKIFRESFKDGKVDPPIFGLNDLYCDLCKITCTGPANFERHIMGNRHHKNVMLDHLGVSSFDVITQYVRKKNKKNRKKGNRASWLETKLEDWKMPLIGLQYITEIQKEDKSVEPRYYCELCDSKSDPRVLMTHLTGVKHRLKYLKACHFDKVPDTVSTATKKATAAPILEEIAAEVEKVEGRQQIKVKIEPELNLSSARKRGGNFGGGGNFKRARTDGGSKFERRGGRGGGGRGGGRGGRGGGRGGRGGGRGGGDWKKFDDRGRDRSRDRDRGRKDSVGRDRDRSFRDNRDNRGNERDYRGKDRERESRKPDYRDDRKRSEDSRNVNRDATQGRRHFQENVATSQRPTGTLSSAAQSWLGQESGTSAQSDFRYEAYKQEPSRNVAYDNSFSPSRYSQLYQTAVSTSQTAAARPAMPPPGTLPPSTQYLQSSGYGLGLTGYLNQK